MEMAVVGSIQNCQRSSLHVLKVARVEDQRSAREFPELCLILETFYRKLWPVQRLILTSPPIFALSPAWVRPSRGSTN